MSLSFLYRSAEKERAPLFVSLRSSLKPAVSIITPVLLLLLWELVADIHAIDTRFFPAPSKIFHALISLSSSGELWTDIGVSLVRIFLGFLWGAVPGVIIGLIMGIVPIVRAALQPLVDATFPIPKIALFPLLLFIFGLGESSKIAIIAIGVIYLVLINTVEGVANIPSIYTDVGRNFKASRWLFFWDIALPGALPFIFAGLKLGMGVALLVIFTAEFLNASSGIGYLIWNAYSVFQIDVMYAGLIVVAVLGLILTSGLDLLERYCIPWKR